MSCQESGRMHDWGDNAIVATLWWRPVIEVEASKLNNILVVFDLLSCGCLYRPCSAPGRPRERRRLGSVRRQTGRVADGQCVEYGSEWQHERGQRRSVVAGTELTTSHSQRCTVSQPHGSTATICPYWLIVTDLPNLWQIQKFLRLIRTKHKFWWNSEMTKA